MSARVHKGSLVSVTIHHSLLASVAHVGLLSDGQRVELGSQEDRFSPAIAEQANYSMSVYSRMDLIPKASEMTGNQPGSALPHTRYFGILMNLAVKALVDAEVRSMGLDYGP